MATEIPKAPDSTSKFPAEAPAGSVTPANQMDEELQQESAKQVGDTGKNDHLPASNSEHGGQTGPEPTRYGDWEKNGRCTDF